MPVVVGIVVVLWHTYHYIVLHKRAPFLHLTFLCCCALVAAARHAALRRAAPFGIFLALIHTSIVGIGNFSSYTWVVWKKGRCLACASSNWVGVSPRVTCTVRTISLVASEAAACEASHMSPSSSSPKLLSKIGPSYVCLIPSTPVLTLYFL